MSFKLKSSFVPRGDQPQAIAELTAGLKRGDQYQTLLGATGTGKTFSMSHVIQNYGQPTLVLSHNKTLAAQLYAEFKTFFPDNAVEFFISYYDYFQPEAYIPGSDTFIEKTFAINDEIDRLRLSATSTLLSGRKDIIVVASVSSIYGLGSPEAFAHLRTQVTVGDEIERDELLKKLVESLYTRNDIEFGRGRFRVRGDVVEIMPAYYENVAYRIEFWGDEIERITSFEPISGQAIGTHEQVNIFPANQFVMPREQLNAAIGRIQKELAWRLAILREDGQIEQLTRLEQRTTYDIEMMKELGYCSGIENYSRHLEGRNEGEPPHCLYDYFPDDFLLMVDESHVSIPQVRAMYKGDRSRKLTLVEHGFRLPSALDNRPLKFDEFESLHHRVVFVSATPADYELEKSEGIIVEQVIRPTGIVDPTVEVRPLATQVDDLMDEIHKRTAKNERVLVTTLTKRMSEDLTEYLDSFGIRVRYMHSEIDALERVEILRELRLGEFDVLVGINLLREGLDLPEVSLVAILDADKEGFLRSDRSLIQTAGRAARNVNGKVILYADRITGSMERMMEETERRQAIQIAYNKKHNIIPETIKKSTEQIMSGTVVANRQKDNATFYGGPEQLKMVADPVTQYLPLEKKKELVEQLKNEMISAAENLAFERAAEIRDAVAKLEADIEESEK